MSKSFMGKSLFVLMLALFLVLAACGGGDDTSEGGSEGDSDGEGTEENEGSEGDGGGDSDSEGSDSEGSDSEGNSDQQIFDIENFDTVTSNDGEPIDGGHLNYGLVSDTVFEGTLNYNFYSGNPDAMILQFIDESLLGMDPSHNYNQEGAATFEANRDEGSITFTIRDGVNWHDGEPVTAEDWVHAYEVIGHPEYTGVRYGTVGFTMIEGMEAYHNGEADEISGIEIHDEKSFTINYERLTPSLLSGGIWTYALPKHIFEDIPVADMAESDAVRQNPIGFGPFKVDSIVPGESVELTKNEDYWEGEPNLDSVTVKVVNPNVVAQELETGGVDLVDSFPAAQFPSNSDMENVEWLGDVDGAYTYIGFKLGDWNAEEGEVNYKPDEMKMGDVELRRAMWYAIDNNAVGERFYNGLRWNATTLITPWHPTYHDDSIETPTYDLEKANQILDEAGYEDTNGDGYREKPNGDELSINFASMSGGETAEPLANYYMQQWDKAGLDVSLVDGRLLEFNQFYDRVGQSGEDDPAIDIYQGAWSVGSDVDPSGLYGREAIFNFPRYASEENDELLEKGLSQKAFDIEYRQEVYSDWQELMVEDIPVIPTLYRSAIYPANERVVNYDISTYALEWHEVGVTQEEPVTAE
ncbi:peptide/nickel transport system substrate-binding protein [Alkalibacillus flavidus]|uniref:Peptide/nickel transport system substrate-binding protein n=1 Tax=Alkalibacillus flavidus TaxID=546021 RepID=A0ABV2KXR0_9BACI